MPLPVAENEERRLAALHGVGILDTAPSPAFDRICHLARDIFDIPIALVSLVDGDRQWFKAKCGITSDGTPRDVSICAHAILEDGVMVVPDAQLDARFADNPHVLGEPHIRFYAGAPLILRPGIRVGTLCVIDTRPRTFSAAEIKALERLSAFAVDELKLHRTVRLLREQVRRRRENERTLERQGQELRRQQVMFGYTERLAHLGSWKYDLIADKLHWSDEVYRISGIPVGQPVTIADALTFFPPEVRPEVEGAVSRALATHGAYDLQLPYVTSGGQARWIHTLGQVEVVDGRAVCLFGVIQDITDRKTTEERFWHLANHDPLTQLPNRALLNDRLEQAVRFADRSGTLTALALVDLDHFKDVNDLHGHDVGDALLCAQARRLAGSVRAGDTVARIGGDEFAVVLSGLGSIEDARVPLERIVSELSQPFEHLGHRLTPRASVGAAFFPDHDRDTAELRKDADLALYHAKSSGRCRYEVFRASLRQERDRRASLATEVRAAITGNELLAHYQPVVSLADGRVSGFEALPRLGDPTDGPRSLKAIEAALRSADLTIALEDRLLARILEDMRGWSTAGVDYGRIGVHVSEVAFRRSDLVERLLKPLSEAGIGPSRLVVEFCEEVLLSRDLKSARTVLQAIRDAGAAVALDDFGAAHASIGFLSKMPIDMIKIDASLLKDARREGDGHTLLTAVVGVSQSLGIDLVAEGVDDVGQLVWLQRRRCTRGQGLLLHAPMPPDEIPRFIRSWPRTWAKLSARFAEAA